MDIVQTNSYRVSDNGLPKIFCISWHFGNTFDTENYHQFFEDILWSSDTPENKDNIADRETIDKLSEVNRYNIRCS